MLNEPSVVAVSERDNRIRGGSRSEGDGHSTYHAYRPMKDGDRGLSRDEAMLRYYMNKALGKWNRSNRK